MVFYAGKQEKIAGEDRIDFYILRPEGPVGEFSFSIFNFLFIKRPVVEISLDIKNKIMSFVHDNIADDAMQQKNRIAL